MSDEIQQEQEDEYAFIGTTNFDAIYDRLIAMVPSVDHRVASSVIYGYYKQWSPQKTAKYYNISSDEYNKYASLFNFKERMVKQVTGRKSKQSNIVDFLNGNIGKVVTPAQLAESVNISLPTFYNFYNANRGYFKKVKRGQFEILNPNNERANS